MAQFDVYRLPGVAGFVVDCQSDLLAGLTSRFVIPLQAAEGTESNIRFNPVFTIAGRRYALLTQLATSISRAALKQPIASLAEHYLSIAGAIDMLMDGV